MKQLTGDSTISGRALYCESETFAIQFHLCVCTNTLFEIVSNDEGTWRRIRLCDFSSKFVDKDDFIEGQSNQFLKDKNLKDKLPKWSLVFISMLVKKAFDSQGIVNNCEVVKASSSMYRQGQDHISTFVKEMIRKCPGKNVAKREVNEQFKIWFNEHQGTRKLPKGTELYEYLDNKFGKYDKVWKNIEIIYPEKEEDDLDSLQC
jgi:phage/plasmid-associated DNA primase